MWRTSIPLAPHQFPRSSHIFCAFCPVLSFLIRAFLLGRHHSSAPVALRLAVWRIAQATSERSGGGSFSQYSSSVPFPSSSWYKSSQYSFHLSAICAASVKFSPVTDWIHCRLAETFESLIWLSEWPAWNFLLCLLLLIPHTCLPAAAVYPLWAFSVPLPSVLDIGSYLSVLLPSMPKYHQIFLLLRLDGSNRFCGVDTPQNLWHYILEADGECRAQANIAVCRVKAPAEFRVRAACQRCPVRRRSSIKLKDFSAVRCPSEGQSSFFVGILWCRSCEVNEGCDGKRKLNTLWIITIKFLRESDSQNRHLRKRIGKRLLTNCRRYDKS